MRSHRKTSKFKMLGYIAAMILMAFGAVELFIGWQIHHNAAMSERWPTSDGIILASHLIELEGSANKKKYEAYVRYGYMVGGKTYTDDTINFKRHHVDVLNIVSQVLKQYPVGMHVKVFYDPTEPGHAVLEPGMPWKADIPLFVGLVFFVFGLFYLWFLVRRGRPTRYSL